MDRKLQGALQLLISCGAGGFKKLLCISSLAPSRGVSRGESHPASHVYTERKEHQSNEQEPSAMHLLSLYALSDLIFT